VSHLSLPTGFGVGVVGTTAAFGTATTGAGATAGVVAAPARWSGPLTFVAADPAPPARLPAGARFGSGGVSFGESDVSPGRVSNVNFGGSPAALGGVGAGFGGATDLGGMSVQAEGGGLRFTLGADVLFDFDKFNLRTEADPVLRKLVEQVRAEVPSRARYMVEGHTDAKGTDVYNLGLSNRRAKSVRDWFVKHGAVTSRDITTVGLGEGSPVAPNERPDGSDDPEGRQRNRRVEIVVTPLP
jgi:outer membrane protein OmpA-like peptidoglycan-associated protein